MNKQRNLIRKHRTTLHLWSRRLVASLMVFVFCVVSVLWAQGNAQSFVNQTAHAHGEGWQNGAVKNWVGQGTLTVYHYDGSNRQSQETFPVALLHEAHASGGGARGDKFQRLIFKAPDPASDGSTLPGGLANAQARDAVLTREGSDGNEAWHSAGPLSTPAGGRAQRLIESQTIRSLEALFNYQKHGRNLADVTAKIRGEGAGNPGTGNGNGGGGNSSDHDRSHATPAFEAAQNREVIEMTDAGGGANKKTTRYYLDPEASGLVARMEFDYDTGTDPFAGKSVALTEVYEFSDYRDVPLSAADPFSRSNGGNAPAATVKFPFLIERYTLGQKVETMVFSQVLLNRNLRAENFRK